jgi:hypothetical protein
MILLAGCRPTHFILSWAQEENRRARVGNFSRKKKNMDAGGSKD